MEDLGSSNGIVVNGAVHRGSCPLNHMDRIYIGSQELVLIDGIKVSIQPEAGPNVICESCGAVNGIAKRRCGECGSRLGSMGGVTLRESRKVFAEDSREDSTESYTWGWPEDTRTETTRDVIDGIAAKAIELGRFEEAERMLLPHLDALLERALRGEPLSKSERRDPEALLANATRNALALAQGLHAMRWIDWVFRVYTAAGCLIEAEAIEVLHALVRSHEYRKPHYIRAYLQMTQNRAEEWGASERFQVRRLEGLAEVIAAR